MPLPMFPVEEGVPGDGNLVAIYGGGPPSVEVIGGVIHHAEVVQTHPHASATVPTPQGRFGEPLGGNALTIWLSGSLNVKYFGDATVTDYVDMLTRWDTVKAKMLLADYELFVYYRTAAPATYRKFKLVNPVILRSQWHNPFSLSYTLAAITTDKTLYSTAPGS